MESAGQQAQDASTAEAAARQQAALLELAHDAIIVRAPDGRILTWSKGATDLYGWTAAEAVGQITHTLLETRVLLTGGPGTETDAALTAQGAWEGELEHTRRDGTRLVVESRQALLRTADGLPEAILEVNRDATARRALVAALAQLETLQAISDAAFAQLTLPVLLRQVLERVTAALGVDNSAILLLDASETTLIVHHAVGPEEAQTGQMRVPVGQGVAGHIAATRQPLIIADLRTVEPVNPLLREQMSSLLGVPLLVEGRLLGVLHVDSATPRQFTDTELHLLQLVADRVALALDNARLYQDALEARDAVGRLQRITAALSAATSSEEVADVIVTAGAEALGAVAGYVGLLAEDGARFLTVRLAGYGPEVRTAWALVSDDAVAPLADAVRAREPVILESGEAFAARYPHLAAVRAAAGGGAATTIPLLMGDRVIGALALGFATARHFTTAERATLRTLGELCAQALERARLYDAAQQARAAVTAERDYLQQILDTLPVGVTIAAPDRRIVVANAASREILGSDVLGRVAPMAADDASLTGGMRRLDGTPYPPEEMPLERVLRDGVAVLGDRQLIRHAQTGRAVVILASWAPLRDAAGTLTGVLTVFQDITTLHELEQTREAFLSSAAHDLRTPLTSIRIQAQLVQRRMARRDTPELTPVLAPLARIQESADAMARLIDELMDVARQQMGGMLDLQRAATDLVRLVQDRVDSHRDASGRTIQLEPAGAALQADVDAARVARVVDNLLSNAVKYSPGESAIWVRLGQEDGPAGPQVVLSVRDEGIGIPAADLPHIFDRFARGRNVIGQIPGTGIGLASARGIVEQHGGTISVESTEGMGATFTVRLPLTAP